MLPQAAAALCHVDREHFLKKAVSNAVFAKVLPIGSLCVDTGSTHVYLIILQAAFCSSLGLRLCGRGVKEGSLLLQKKYFLPATKTWQDSSCIQWLFAQRRNQFLVVNADAKFCTKKTFYLPRPPHSMLSSLPSLPISLYTRIICRPPSPHISSSVVRSQWGCPSRSMLPAPPSFESRCPAVSSRVF